MNVAKLRSLEENHIRGAKTLIRIMEHPRRLITAMLIGNNLVNVAASALATRVLIDLFEGFGLHSNLAQLAAVTGCMTLLLLIFGEITPKTIAIKDPIRFALVIRKPIQFFLFIFNPLVALFHFFAMLISQVVRLKSASVYSTFSAEELKALATIGAEEGALEIEEREMIHSVINFSKTIVREIMTPRTDAVCIEVGSNVSQAIALITKHGHSRIPVYEEKIDNIMGVIYAKDLLNISDPDNVSIRKMMRSVVFIPETKSIETLLHQMQKSRFHMAIVMDEYGGMAGLVTLEDIIEEIIGEIQDEYDPEEAPEFTDLGNGHYLVDGGLSVDDFKEKVRCNILTEDVEYDTMGGFILSLLDRLPVKGEHITFQNLELIVREVERRRIGLLEVIVKEDLELFLESEE